MSFTSPRVRGEVGAQRRVRGTLDGLGLAESPPHPETSLRFVSDLSPQAGRGEASVHFEIQLRDLAARFARVLLERLPPNSEGTGNAGRLMRPQPRVQSKKHTSVVTRSHRNDPAFPAQWFYGHLVLSPRSPHKRLECASEPEPGYPAPVDPAAVELRPVDRKRLPIGVPPMMTTSVAPLRTRSGLGCGRR